MSNKFAYLSHIVGYRQRKHIRSYHNIKATVHPIDNTKWQCGSCDIDIAVVEVGLVRHTLPHTHTSTDTQSTIKLRIHVNVHWYKYERSEWTSDGKIQRSNRKWEFDVYALDGHRSAQLLQLNGESQRTRKKKSIEAMLAVCVCVWWLLAQRAHFHHA